jgi:hypothetical protein
MECRPNGPKGIFSVLGFRLRGWWANGERKLSLFLSVFLKTKQNGAFIAFSVQSTFGKEQPKSHFGRGHLGGLSRTDEMITFHSRTLLVVAYRYATLKNL